MPQPPLKSRIGLACVVLAFLCSTNAKLQAAQIFYVAPDGNDANTGSQLAPFASLTRARDAVRTWRQFNTGDVVVEVAGGVYRLRETLRFDLRDSCPEAATTNFRAAKDQRPVLSAAWPITAWTKMTDRPEGCSEDVWVADLPQGIDWIATLYDNDGLLPRAREPGFFPESGKGTLVSTTYAAGDVAANLDVGNAELNIVPDRPWSQNILTITEHDPQHRPLRTSVPATYAFEGFTFMHGDRWAWEKTKQGWGLQHDWEMFDRPTAMVRLCGAEECRFDRCRFAHCGATGIRLDLHCQRNCIQNSLIEYVGGVGILFAGYGPGTKDVNRENTLRNCHIHHTGQLILATPGVFVWQSGHNRLVNNLIHDTPYCAVVISGRISATTSSPPSDPRRTQALKTLIHAATSSCRPRYLKTQSTNEMSIWRMRRIEPSSIMDNVGLETKWECGAVGYGNANRTGMSTGIRRIPVGRKRFLPKCVRRARTETASPLIRALLTGKTATFA